MKRKRKRGGTRTRSKQTLGSGAAPSGVECRSANPRLLTARTAAQWREHRDNYSMFCLANLQSSRQSALNEARDETAPRERPTRPRHLYGNETEEHERGEDKGVVRL